MDKIITQNLNKNSSHKKGIIVKSKAAKYTVDEFIGIYKIERENVYKQNEDYLYTGINRKTRLLHCI